MSKSDGDNLENFFKKKAQNPEIQFHEADWEKLEAQLNTEMPTASPIWRSIKKLWPIPLIAIIAFFGWYSYNRASESEMGIQSKIDPVESHVSSESNLKTEKDAPIVESQESNREINAKYKDDLLTKSINVNQNISLHPNGKNVSVHQPPIIIPISGDKINNSGYVVSGNGDEAFRLREASLLHFLLPIQPESGIIESAKTPIETLDVEHSNKIITNTSSFILGVGYSPDFSTIGLDNFISPGSRLKIYLEYNIKNRFAISTGVEWVKNKYEALGEEYQAPQGYWYNSVSADETYGECLMIDVPLNIRYQVFTSGKHQLFVSAGASTYFLLKEDYYFDYEQDDPDLPHYWGTDKMSIYPFGIINASIGYEYLLHSGGSIQLEPYMKIPTAGVGWGNVDLYTVGAYISYRYRIGK